MLTIDNVKTHKKSIDLEENLKKNKKRRAECQRLMPVILGTWEAEIGRIAF
jgi:hypothetical protein